MGHSVGQWVGSGHITKYQINLDLIKIIQFCLKIYDLLDIFWTFYLNHLSPLWGYFFLVQLHFNTSHGMGCMDVSDTAHTVRL